MAKYITTASMCIWIISFFFPMFNGYESNGILMDSLKGTNFTLFLANIFYAIALFSFKKAHGARILFSAVAIMLASAAFSVHEFKPFDQDDSKTRPVSIAIGFWIWLGSFIILFLWLVLAKFIEKKMNKSIPGIHQPHPIDIN